MKNFEWCVRFVALLLISMFAVGLGKAQTRTLTVGSMPSSGVDVTLSPPDLDGATGMPTAFNRRYSNGTAVLLTAPSNFGAMTFVKWQRNGVDFSNNPSASLAMNADYAMNAVYLAPSQLLANGGFESNFTGWTSSGNLAVESASPYVASEGVKLVAFNGANRTPNAVLTQQFATTSGATYTLAYDVGVVAYNTREQRLQVTLTGSGSLFSKTESVFGVGSGTVRWSPKSYTFVANSASTTLKFADISATSDSTDLLLDRVRITTSASGPGTPPTVAADSATIHSGQKVRLAVLANDSGLINQSTVEIVSPPSVGTALVEPTGEILYSHSGTTVSPVSFSYRVSGEGGRSQPAVVTISVSSALRIPNNQLNVPSGPPASEVQIVQAYPGVNFTNPLCLVSPPADNKRLFVCELGGKIKVIPDVTAANPTSSLVLDLLKVITTPARTPAESWNPGAANEAGLTGFAFHPNYASNGYFFVSYLMVKASDPLVWYQRLSRFTVPTAQIGSPAPVASATSERILIEQRDRHDGHNGSDLHFGSDGYLYWALGDEVNPNDYRKNAQRIDMNFFSGLLRIDVDKKPGNLEPNAHPNPAAASLGFSTTNSIPRDQIPAGSGKYVARYSIPIDNPYVPTSKGGTWNGMFNGSAISAANLPYVRSEFWAVGLRSPWRFFIDKPTGEIWVGDVGQNTYEEINLITKGGNYGWAFREGLHTGPRTPPAGLTFKDPIYEYSHTSQPGDSNYKGNSIIGGVVYRGSRFESLRGAYIFGDYVSGNIWALTRPGGVTTVKRIAGQTSPSTFGTDPSNGDVLVTDHINGRIMRIVVSTVGKGFPSTLGATGLFADLTDLSPAPGVLPYQPNLTFWSDHAVKRRWFIIPDANSKMAWSRDGSWTFPAGQIWVKHFDLETQRGNPASPRKRIETRLLVKNPTGVYGVSYRWNDAGTEATLVGDGGEDLTVNITVDGAPYAQRWNIPSRSQCVTCHSPKAGHALSFNTRQLNLDHVIHGFSGNQIDLLRAQGYFSNTPEASTGLPRHVRPDDASHSLETRVRSYLAVNCAYCHAGTSGTAPTAWDARPELTLAQTGLINGFSNAAGADYKLIVPGDTTHSVILRRMIGSGGFTRMPPLGSSEIDSVNIDLVTDWINQLPPNPNSAPVAVADSHLVQKDVALVIPAAGVLANDSDADGDSLTAILNASPSHGSVILNTDGGFNYTPEPGFTGSDSFTYHANDGNQDSDIATVSISVNQLASGTLVNGSFEFGLTGWTTVGNIAVKSGSPYLPTDGANLAGFNTAQSIPNGVLSQSFATVAGQSYTLAFDAGVLAYNTYSQKLLVTITGTQSLLSKSITINGVGNGTNRWLPQSFSFVADSALTNLAFRDQSTTSSNIDLLLDDVRIIGRENLLPVAVADSYSAVKDGALTVPQAGVLANDTDAESTPLVAVLETGPGHGSLILNANGGFTYTPQAGFTGVDSFTYHANDGSGNSNTATVSITVSAVGTGGLVNGSFESGFTGWTASGNLVVGSAAPYKPTDGTKLAVFNSGQTTPNGTLSQAIATVAGQTYTLAFDAGVVAYNTKTQTVLVTVTGAGTVLSKTVTLTGLGTGSNRWLAQSFTFVADSGLSALTFRDQSTTTQNLDLMIDKVRISEAAILAAGSLSEHMAQQAVTPLEPGIGTPTLSGSPGNFTISMSATTPGLYVLQRSEDLRTWVSISEKWVGETGPVVFQDFRDPADETPPEGRVFYRIGLRPETWDE